MKKVLLIFNKNKDPECDLVEVKQIIEVFTALSVFDLISDDETSKQTKNRHTTTHQDTPFIVVLLFCSGGIE
jgi:hypothetical protein